MLLVHVVQNEKALKSQIARLEHSYHQSEEKCRQLQEDASQQMNKWVEDVILLSPFPSLTTTHLTYSPHSLTLPTSSSSPDSTAATTL